VRSALSLLIAATQEVTSALPELACTLFATKIQVVSLPCVTTAAVDSPAAIELIATHRSIATYCCIIVITFEIGTIFTVVRITLLQPTIRTLQLSAFLLLCATCVVRSICATNIFAQNVVMIWS
jgi:hypothetical protein